MKKNLLLKHRCKFFLVLLLLTIGITTKAMPVPSPPNNIDTVCMGARSIQFGYEELNVGVERYVITSLDQRWLFDGTGRQYINQEGIPKSSGTITMPVPLGQNEGSYNFSFYVVDSLFYCKSDTLYFTIVITSPKDSLLNAIACNGGGYDFNGQILTSSGIYYDTIMQGSCMSIVTLNLLIQSDTMVHEYANSCYSYTWNLTGQTYTSSGQYFYQVPGGRYNTNCDSTIVLNLTINDTARGVDFQYACGPYTWIDGVTYTSSTNLPTYRYVGASAQGCDSIVTLNLTIGDEIRIVEDITACEKYTWNVNGQTYLNNTTDSVIFRTAGGCDSIMVLNLTINPHVRGVDTVIVPRLDLVNGYSYHDQVFYQEGEYEVVFQGFSSKGCDSIVTLSLLALDTVTGGIDTVYICAGTTYDFYGTDYSTTGLYTHPTYSVSGGDSIARLYLIVNDTLRAELYATICVGGFTEPIVINGNSYVFSENQAGEYQYPHKFKTNEGCDTIVTMHLTVMDHPKLVITPDTSLCYGNYITLRVSSPTANNFEWASNPIDATLTTPNQSTIRVKPLISTTYTVTADIQPYNCMTTASTFVYVTKPLVAKMYANPHAVTANNLDVLFKDISEGNIGRAWEFLSNNPMHSYHKIVDENAKAEQYFIMPCDMDSGEVTLKVWNELYEQCVDTAKIKIAIDCENDIWIPNTFTPAAGTNNRFEIISDKIDHFEMYIYTRAGLIAYQVKDLKTHNNEHGWNGRINNSGKECPVANYVYLIRYSTKKDPKTILEKAGSVLLLR